MTTKLMGLQGLRDELNQVISDDTLKDPSYNEIEISQAMCLVIVTNIKNRLLRRTKP